MLQGSGFVIQGLGLEVLNGLGCSEMPAGSSIVLLPNRMFAVHMIERTVPRIHTTMPETSMIMNSILSLPLLDLPVTVNYDYYYHEVMTNLTP